MHVFSRSLDGCLQVSHRKGLPHNFTVDFDYRISWLIKIPCIFKVVRRAPASITQEGSTPRYLLSPVAVAGPSVSPRAASYRVLRVCLCLETRRGLRWFSFFIYLNKLLSNQYCRTQWCQFRFAPFCFLICYFDKASKGETSVQLNSHALVFFFN